MIAGRGCEAAIADSTTSGTTAVAGSVLTYVQSSVTLAGILAGPLVALAPSFVAALSPRGTLVLSGLLVTQAREVSGAYRARGLVQVATLARGEWMTLVLARRGRGRPGASRPQR